MGQFPQDREDGQNVAFFNNFWSSAVTKRSDWFNFSQLFWRDFFLFPPSSSRTRAGAVWILGWWWFVEALSCFCHTNPERLFNVHFPRWVRFFDFLFLADAFKSLPRPHCERAPSARNSPSAVSAARGLDNGMDTWNSLEKKVHFTKICLLGLNPFCIRSRIYSRCLAGSHWFNKGL